MLQSRILFVPLLLATCWSCSKSKPPEAPTAPGGVTEEAVAEEPGDMPGKDPERSIVVVDPKILELCDIPIPHFAFDSSALSQQAKDALDALAQCFVEGKAQGKSMSLVGHADPRGTEEYNMALGQRRAGSVASHLGTGGLGEDRIETSSRGELDATGTDEESWEKDRKVQIFLIE